MKNISKIPVLKNEWLVAGASKRGWTTWTTGAVCAEMCGNFNHTSYFCSCSLLSLKCAPPFFSHRTVSPQGHRPRPNCYGRTQLPHQRAPLLASPGRYSVPAAHRLLPLTIFDHHASATQRIIFLSLALTTTLTNPDPNNPTLILIKLFP